MPQREKGLSSWKGGGREHDRILRLIAGPSLKVDGARRRARRWVDELLAADRDRMAALRQSVHAAIIYADTILAEKPPTKEQALIELVEEKVSMGMGMVV